MIAKLLAPLLIAGATVAGITLAPAATARTLDCEETGTTSIYQWPGHNALNTIQVTPDQNGNFGWPLGTGPIPPVMAMN